MPMGDVSVTWTISVVELVDSISVRKYRNSLLFDDYLVRADDYAAFPTESLVAVYESIPDKHSRPTASGRFQPLDC